MNLVSFLLPWIIGREAGDALELAFVFGTVMVGIIILVLFGKFWQE